MFRGHSCHLQVLMYEPYVELAERLNRLVPISGAVKSIFLRTGAEAARECHQDRTRCHRAIGGHRSDRSVPWS